MKKEETSVFENTIVGISTPLAKGAISIVRLSGMESITLVNKVFKGKDLLKVKSHTINYGYIINPLTKSVIDEVLVSVFRAPKTYTKEDIVEINCHGGVFVTNCIYELMIMQGAQPAQGGEFTKRAFLNGRIDLTEAEAVMDVIDAKNKAFASVATKALIGKTKNVIDKFKEQILNIIAIINVNIDYPEYDDVEELTNDKIKPKIISIKNELQTLLDNSQGVKYFKNGIDTVIIGKPNVGKSSILNALVKENRAIVTNIPGTTRDIIEAQINLNNITLNLIDTAGIRDTDDIIEQIGVSKSLEKIEKAQIILLILDGSKLLDEEDYKLLKLVKNRPHLKVINKGDLAQKIQNEELPDAITISALLDEGIDYIEKAILKKINLDNIYNEDFTYVSNARQLSKINEAIEALQESLDSIKQCEYIDFTELSLRKAWSALGEITGEVNTDSLLDELFSKFCLGK